MVVLRFFFVRLFTRERIFAPNIKLKLVSMLERCSELELHIGAVLDLPDEGGGIISLIPKEEKQKTRHQRISRCAQNANRSATRTQCVAWTSNCLHATEICVVAE